MDGFFAGPKGEIDWFQEIPKDKEFDACTQEGARSGNTLLFGRTTYEMMKSYWPTPEAEPRWKTVTLLREIDEVPIGS